MSTCFRFRLLVISCILAGCLAGAAGAAGLGIDWRERASEEGPFLGVTITPDASVVLAGGNQMYIRVWDGERIWGSKPGRVTAMTPDGKRFVTGMGNSVIILDRQGIENWSRTMDGVVTAVAIAPDWSFVISADDKGNYISWGKNGEFTSLIRNATAKKVAISPAGDLVVVLTDKGLRFYDRKLELVWYDNRTESLDEFVTISGDSYTIITAGYNEVASYTRDGTLNWRKEITKDPIIDMDCSLDGAAIIVAGQDRNIVAIDRYGMVRWKYEVEQWVNAVGVSRDASVIAAGGIDRTVYVLGRSGTLITKRSTDAIIQPRSIAVSSDGRRIVVADQMNIYGFSMFGDAVAPDVPDTYTLAPLNPVSTTNPTAVPTATQVTTAATPAALAVPVPPTTYTPADPFLLLPALGAAALLYRRVR
jgi:WD40 repeat protein